MASLFYAKFGENMNSIQTDQRFLMRSTLFTFGGTALKIIAPILTIVVARVFGKEIFGIYVSTQLLVFTLSRVAVLGFDKGMHRYLPQNLICCRPSHEGIVESLKIVIALAFLISSVFWIGAFFDLQRFFSGLSMLSSREISLYILSVTPYTVLLLFAGASEGNRHPQYKIFINDFAVTTFAPLVALCLYFGGFADKLSLPVGLFVSNVLGVMMYVVLMKRQFPKICWMVKKKIPRELLDFSLPIGFSEVVSAFLLRVDLWMVLVLVGPEAAGIYAVMVTISNGLKTVRQSYNPILQPVVAGMSKNRLATDLKPVYSYCVSMVTLIQLAIGFFIILFPEQTMMIAGKSFITKENPIAVLGILMLGNLLNGFWGLSGAVINGLGKSKFMLGMNVVSLIFAILMNALLIPFLGIAGAAVSSMSYQILQCVWMNLYLRRMGYWPYQGRLMVQGIWILLFAVIYLVENRFFSPSLISKGVLYAVLLLGIAGTFWWQGLSKKRER